VVHAPKRCAAAAGIQALVERIHAGELDAELPVLAAAIAERQPLLAAAHSLITRASLRVGDRVRINHRARPLYLHGHTGTVAGFYSQSVIVRLDQPAERSRDRLSCSHATKRASIGGSLTGRQNQRSPPMPTRSPPRSVTSLLARFRPCFTAPPSPIRGGGTPSQPAARRQPSRKPRTLGSRTAASRSPSQRSRGRGGADSALVRAPEAVRASLIRSHAMPPLAREITKR
jgi:hypothetical protein